MKVSVSFLKSKYNLEETIKKIEETSCDFIHIDYMDHLFVPNKSCNLEDLLLLKNCKKPLEVHLMVESPWDYIMFFKNLGVSKVYFHYECGKTYFMIDLLRKNGLRVGLAIKPDTEIEEIQEFLPIIDSLLLLTVNPGFGGQTLKEEVLDKIEEAKKLKENLEIVVDGGVNNENISKIKADTVVVGSYICMSDDYEKKIESLRV